MAHVNSDRSTTAARRAGLRSGSTAETIVDGLAGTVGRDTGTTAAGGSLRHGGDGGSVDANGILGSARVVVAAGCGTGRLTGAAVADALVSPFRTDKVWEGL